VILGDTNCGKTSLVTRFAQGYYHPNLNHRSKSAPNSPNNGSHTNAASSVSPASSHRNPNFVTKSIPVTASNIPTKIQIWDVAGVPNNTTTTTTNNTISNKGTITAAKCYYSNASAILLGYDVTSRASYDGMRSWLNELRSSSSTTNKNNNSVSFNNVVIAIVALKIDLLDDYPYKGGEVVPEYEVEQLAQTLNVMYIPTSAKLDINVTSLFSRVAEEVLERRKQQREGSVGGGIGGLYNSGTTLTGAATTSSTAYEKKGSDATNTNNGDNNNVDNDHRDDYDDVTDKNGNEDDDGTNQFGKRKRSSSGCAPASAVFGMMGRGKEEENGGNMDGNNNGNNDNMMEEDMGNDDDSLNDGEKKKKDDEDDDENTGSFFMMCGNTTWCGNTADTIEG
jgi:GTPase SAR1 family protein